MGNHFREETDSKSKGARVAPVRTFLSWLKRIVSSSHSSFALFICVLALTFAYRIQLTIGLFTNSVKPFDFNPALHPVWLMLAYLPYDLALALAWFLLSWLLSRMKFGIRQTNVFSTLKISGFVLLHIVIITLLLVHEIHLRLLFSVQTGLDYSAIMEAFSAVSLMEIVKLVEVTDCLFLLLPIGLFWLVLLSPPSLRTSMAGISFALIILLPLISLFAANDRTKNVPAEMRLNPALFLLSDVADRALYQHASRDRDRGIVNKNESGLQFTRSMGSNQPKPLKLLPPQNTHPWNIVFFIMESVGTRYIFDTDYGIEMPMPFLHRIAKEGWYLKRHYTTSNVSTKAIFSLLSGLYDFFGRQNFGLRADAGIPSLHNFLPNSYDSFLVTPSSLSWYFPVSFVKNSGLTEMHHYENLKFKIKETYHSLGHYIARDEIETVDFFIQRLNQAREPFLGIYISFAAHFPYFDYGPDYRILEDDGRLISRYYNNLNLLDQMIKRIYDHLQTRGQLERTIFVIVGDHGQAFGQHHPDNFMHYRYSYNENLETPAIIYQPVLFKPKVFESPTSHVDLLPTLLDAMRISYNPEFFDGESLFHDRQRGKNIFFYGLEESISLLDANQIKVQYSLKKNRCWAFNLKVDPDERNPLDCSSYQPQLEVLRDFTGSHDESLVKYNAWIKTEGNTQGHKDPSP
jgi:phosphoglycerol transferase MdoB-like AlkP superfamily enzyme